MPGLVLEIAGWFRNRCKYPSCFGWMWNVGSCPKLVMKGWGGVESEVAICMTHHLASYSHGTRTGISVFRKHSFWIWFSEVVGDIFACIFFLFKLEFKLCLSFAPSLTILHLHFHWRCSRTFMYEQTAWFSWMLWSLIGLFVAMTTQGLSFCGCFWFGSGLRTVFTGVLRSRLNRPVYIYIKKI